VGSNIVVESFNILSDMQTKILSEKLRRYIKKVIKATSENNATAYVETIFSRPRILHCR
jgi:hypothetical protein